MIVSGLIVAIVIWLLMQGQSHTTLPGKPSAYESFNFNLQSADGKLPWMTLRINGFIYM